jgi:hypothetical protein
MSRKKEKKTGKQYKIVVEFTVQNAGQVQTVKVN